MDQTEEQREQTGIETQHQILKLTWHAKLARKMLFNRARFSKLKLDEKRWMSCLISNDDSSC